MKLIQQKYSFFYEIYHMIQQNLVCKFTRDLRYDVLKRINLSVFVLYYFLIFIYIFLFFSTKIYNASLVQGYKIQFVL